MRIIIDKKPFDVYLDDDGSLDTCISITNVETNETREFRFDSECAAEYRSEDGEMSARGLYELACECIDDFYL